MEEYQLNKDKGETEEIKKFDAIQIKQNELKYDLNIETQENTIYFTTKDKNQLPYINYKRSMSFKEIKASNKKFDAYNSFNDFYDYLKSLSINNKLNIKKNNNKLSIILNDEVLLKEQSIEISLFPEKVDLELNIKEICEELISIKEKIKEIDNLKNENKSKDNEINNLKNENIELKKEIDDLKNKNKEKEKVNEIKNLKNEIKKLNDKIDNLKIEDKEIEINNLKDENKKLKKEIDNFKKQGKEKGNEFKELKIRIDNFKIEDKEKEINDLKNDKNKLKKEVDNLKNENKDLIKKYGEINNEINYIKGLNSDTSIIMKDSEKSIIFPEIEKKLNKKIKKIIKLYQATIDGGEPMIFHNKCDNIPNTLVLVQSEGNRRFGGFTPIPWTLKGGNKLDPEMKTFVFSLDNKKIYYLKRKDSVAVYHGNISGPSFGQGFDIGIEGNPIKEKKLYTFNYSYDYKGENHPLSEYENDQFLKALEYEVFQLIFY